MTSAYLNNSITITRGALPMFKLKYPPDIATDRYAMALIAACTDQEVDTSTSPTG
jgi:hypothetical protein